MEEVWQVVHGTQSMLKTGLNRSLMRKIFDKWVDTHEGRRSELLIDLATDKKEANSPNKVAQQERSEEVVYMSRSWRGTMRSKTVIDKINDMKMKMENKVTLRKTGKTKVDSELSAKAVNSAKRKRIEDVMDMGQGDDRLDIHKSKPMRVNMKEPVWSPWRGSMKLEDSQTRSLGSRKNRSGHCWCPVNTVDQSERSHATMRR